VAVIPSQTDYDLSQLKVRNQRIKVDLLNFNFQTINSLEGKVTDGSISIDATSDIRRTCNITLVVEDSTDIIAPGGQVWLDKFIKVYVGTDNPRNGNKTVWNNMGLFLINNPESVYNATTNTITFEGLDLMAKLTGRRNGQLPAVTTVVPAESKVADVVKQTITQLGGFDKYIIQDAGYEIPYDIKKDMGSTIYDLLVEIRDLYSDWEMFFDVDGVFHWQQIPNGINEPVVLDFNQLKQKVIISETVDVDFENVKNHIIVYGRLLDNGEQVMATSTDTISSSPYNVDSIGQINYIVDDEKIYNNDLAQQRADYELFLHARMNNSITLEIVPLYWLNDVNVKIAHTNKNVGIEGEYLIKTLEIPLGVGNNMTITAIKVYPKEPEIETIIAEYPYTGQWYSSTQEQFPYLP
jgi:hypothetical protein